MINELAKYTDAILAAEIERRGHRVVLGQTHAQAFGLTGEQAKVYAFIRERELATGVSPTVREINQRFGRNSMSWGHEMLRKLTERGVLRKLPQRARSVTAVIPKENDLPV